MWYLFNEPESEMSFEMVCGFHSKAFFIFCGVISVASCILSEDVSQASEFYVF